MNPQFGKFWQKQANFKKYEGKFLAWRKIFKKCHKFAKFEDIGCAGIKKLIIMKRWKWIYSYKKNFNLNGSINFFLFQF